MKLALVAFLLSVPLMAQVPDAPKPQGFFANRANITLAADNGLIHVLDASSTEQNIHNACHCFRESGTFYGTFSLASIAAHAPAQYAWSLGLAAGQVEVARMIWNRGQRTHHAKLYGALGRGVLLWASADNAINGPINNWTARGRK